MHHFYSKECHSQARSVVKKDPLPGSAKSNSTASASGSASAIASNDTTTTVKKGLPWWKLARPTRLGRRRSLAELSANSSCVCRAAKEGGEMPSSGQGLFSAERAILPSSSLSLSSCHCSARSEKRQQSTETACASTQHKPQNLSCLTSFVESTESMKVPSSPEVGGAGDHIVAHGSAAESHSTATTADASTSWLPAYSSGSKRSKAVVDHEHPYEQQLSFSSSTSTAALSCSKLVSESARRGQGEDSDHNRRDRVGDNPTDARSPRTPPRSSVRTGSSPYDTATSTLGASAAASTPPSGVSDARRDRVVVADSLKSMVIATGDTAMMGFDYGEEGLDDETALGRPSRPRVVYDILAVDRGCGNCDTSVVPFPLNDGGRVPTERMRAVTAGQGDFLARRGFAAGLVAHFLEETNSEFRVLQGGSSPGMNAKQLEDATAKLEEVFAPAVKRLHVRQSTEVLLDSLFEGEDDAGPFVVRFEVTITRCHPGDLASTSTKGLQECAPVIRETMSEEGLREREMHEVVFVGRPMWELVSPVLDFPSSKAADGKAET